MNSIFASIDIETTGLDEDHCSIIEIGAVVDDWLIPKTNAPEFHCYVKQDHYKGQPYALSMHSEIFKRIATKELPYCYMYPSEAVKELGLFLLENGAYVTDPDNPDREARAVVAGKNFQFDDRFLRQLPRFDEHVKYHHRYLDPAMLYWDPLTDVKPPGSATCMYRAGLAGEVSHTALEDAKMVARLIQIAVARRVKPIDLLEVYRDRGEVFPF